MPATAEAKLTKPERRAVDVSSVSGASTRTAMLAEIGFAGKLGDALGRGALRRAQVKVELLTASGQKTVVTERGPDRRAHHGRTGTAGGFQVIRDERSLLLLVEGLSEPVRQVVVSTGIGAAVASRDGVVFDQVSVPIRVIDYQEAIDHERQRVEQEIGETESELEEADKKADRLVDLIHKANEQLARDEPRREVGPADFKREYQERLKEVNEKRTTLQMKLRALRRWLEILNQIRIIVIIPL